MDIVWIFIVVASLIWLFIRRPPHPVDQLPGPPTIPFFGNILMFSHPNRLEGFKAMNECCQKYRPLFRLWFTKFLPVIYPIAPKYVEPILSSSEHTTKSYEYKTIASWLGEGLLTSNGSKWHARRKLLTPAFHFKILEDFIPVFCEKTRILVKKLRNASENNPDGFDIVPYVTLCALDMICETAMRYPINAQEHSDSEYVKHVHEIGELIYYRNRRPWLSKDWIFGLTSAGRKQKECLKFLHGFTDMVIKKRKEEMKSLENSNKFSSIEAIENKFGKMNRIAFLDMLLKVSETDPNITDSDIREEVDTFMFEGHDTTAVAMSWTLYFLSVHHDIQSRCVEELDEIFTGSDRDPNMTDLVRMKYLERVIKETLRIRPSVRYVGRRLIKSIKYEGYDEFPADTVIHVNIYNIHRDPKYFPDPEKFDPDRFLPENCIGRHPHAYIPFSAGPRNCIGQRFAMLEMKEVVSTVLRHFRLESCDPELYGIACPDVVVRPMNGLRTRLYPRNAA